MNTLDTAKIQLRSAVENAIKKAMENGELKMLKYESFTYEYWGSNEQTTRKDILYMSSGTMFTVGDGNAKSYLYTQSPIDQQPASKYRCVVIV